MKNIIKITTLLILIIVLLLSGCVKNPDEKVIPDTLVKEDVTLKEFEHDGHTYLVFVLEGYKYGGLQVVHSPECNNCQKESGGK